jgi:hypothetical protein
VPVIYIADWPDRYIHTQRDVPDNLDPTKMRRAIFIAAASGYFLATLTTAQREALAPTIRNPASLRHFWDRALGLRFGPVEPREMDALLGAVGRFRAYGASLEPFGLQLPISLPPVESTAAAGPVYRRVLNEGPMDGFGYSWFDDRLARAGITRPRLLAREPDGEGASFGYEALNLVDGRRSLGEIRDDLAATVGDAPIEEVREYLDVLVRLGVLAVENR